MNTNAHIGKNGSEMESHVFQKAQTREEYLSFIAKLIIHVNSECASGSINFSESIQRLKSYFYRYKK